MLADIGTSYILGLITPLAAACVLPLYPGFLAFISNQLSGRSDSKKIFALIGLIVTAGVILFMLLFGILFDVILKKSLTSIIQIVSPIAFGILLIVSIMLIANKDFTKIIPKAKLSIKKNPYVNAFSFGFFFGAIVIPCNPAFIIALLARVTASASGFASGLLSFIMFGVGIGTPLLLFSLLSATKSSSIINFITAKQRAINLVSGILMLLVSLYYLIVVFSVLGDNNVTHAIGIPLKFLFGWVGTFVPPTP